MSLHFGSKAAALQSWISLYWIPTMCQEEDMGLALYGEIKPFNLRQAVKRPKMKGFSAKKLKWVNCFQEGLRVGVLTIDLGRQKLKLYLSKTFNSFALDQLCIYRDDLHCPQ